MILSINFSIRATVLLLAILLGFSNAAAQNDAAEAAAKPVAGAGRLEIAVYPVFNLSANPAPLAAIRLQMIEELKDANATLIAEDVLERAMAQNRVRYVGGLDMAAAQAMRQDAGADCVLITVLELYSDANPPKIALTARLVSTASRTEIIWIDGIGLAGDDTPGLLGLSLIEDPQKLMRKAVHHLAQSLTVFLSGQGKGSISRPAKKKFGSEIIYRKAGFAADGTYRVAVVPFFNPSARTFAGEILALHFVRQLWALDKFKVFEPGVVRQQLLKARIIMNSGISLADADLIGHELNADLILNGKVIEYQDYRGYSGVTKVDFAAEFFDRASREVVWSVKSYHQGDDGVFFFDWGRVNTAYTMASQMVQLAVEELGE